MKTSDIIRAAAERTMEWPFRVWGFGEAIAIDGLLVASVKLGDNEAWGYVHALLRTWLGKGGPRSPEDHVAPGKMLLQFYEDTEEEIYLEAAYRLAHIHRS
ncbi:MAG: hypothetical protein GY953_13975, partial [bacterium]|nr:hypothetical protein [bacterium]